MENLDKKILKTTAEIKGEVISSGGFSGGFYDQQPAEVLKQYIPKPKEQYTSTEILKAAFENENDVASTIANQINGLSYSGFEDPNFDSIDFIEQNVRNTKYAPFYKDFISLQNENDANQLLKRIDRQDKNDEILASSGIEGGLYQLAAGITSASNFIPIGGSAYKAYKAGKVLKGAALTAGAAGVSVAAQEAALHATQETRTLEESAVNVAGGAILGGLLGTGAALLSKRKFNKLSNTLEKDLSSEKSDFVLDPDTGKLSKRSVGAAEALKPLDNYLPEDYTKFFDENPDLIITLPERGEVKLKDLSKELGQDDLFHTEITNCALIWGIK